MRCREVSVETSPCRRKFSLITGTHFDSVCSFVTDSATDVPVLFCNFHNTMESSLNKRHRSMQGKAGAAALITAVQEGNTGQVCHLLECGDVDIEHQDYNGQTPLIVASLLDDVEIAQLLLDLGANVDHIDKGGRTALVWASSKDHVEVVRLLLECVWCQHRVSRPTWINRSVCRPLLQ
jgi:hypothetical protein